MSNKKGEFEEYLGDRLYADFDGYQICLSANDRASGSPTDEVYLKPGVIGNLLTYIKTLQKKGVLG